MYPLDPSKVPTDLAKRQQLALNKLASPYIDNYAGIVRPVTLKPPKNGPVSPNLTRDMLRKALTDAHAETQYTFDDLAPYRLRITYRIVRKLVVMLGFAMPNEQLQDCLHVNGSNPWKQKAKVKNHAARRFTVAHRDRYLDDMTTAIAFGLSADQRYTVVPPDPTPAALNVPPHKYEPRMNEPDLVMYCLLIEHIADGLNLHTVSTKACPNEGRYGTAGLFSPWTVRVAFPEPQELIEFENQLIKHTLDVLTTRSSHAAYVSLKAQFGYTDPEIEATISMARTAATRIVTDDMDVNRAMMQLRLEGIYKEARKDGQRKIQLDALKQLSLVQGLTQDTDTDLKKTFIDIVKMQGQQENTKQVPSKVVDNLPEPGETPQLPNKTTTVPTTYITPSKPTGA